MFAVMIKTDYAQKKVFIDNFWKGFRRVWLGRRTVLSIPSSVALAVFLTARLPARPTFRQVLKGKKKDLITSFSKCNWDNIYAWAEAEREKKKNLSSEALTVAAREIPPMPQP